MTTSKDMKLLRCSLVCVWLSTQVVSIWEWNRQSRQLLADGGVTSSDWAAFWIAAGVVIDLVLGLAIWLRPSRRVYWSALIAMTGMTLIATVLIPQLWLHPLGPLLKNIPIAAVLFVLARRAA